jgi:hypothetical protein
LGMRFMEWMSSIQVSQARRVGVPRPAGRFSQIGVLKVQNCTDTVAKSVFDNGEAGLAGGVK